MQNNVITIFMETHTDKEILDLINSIDFKQATWSEERNNIHVFDFGSLTIKVKPSSCVYGNACIIAIGDIPCAVDFENYEDFTAKLSACKESMRERAVKALIELKNAQKTHE